MQLSTSWYAIMVGKLPASKPIQDLDRLTDQARFYIAASARPNTKRAYAAQLRLWIQWAAANGTNPFPADPVQVANYLAHRAQRGHSPSTLRTVVAAIKAGHDANGISFDTKAPAISRTLRGISNSTLRLPRQAEPLRGPDVLDLVLRADASPIGRRDAALLAVGYIFALRRSELVGLDFETLGTGSGALKLTGSTIEIALARSKTGQGEPECVAVPRDKNPEAVKAIERWIAIAGVQPGEPLFRNISKGARIGGRLHPNSIPKIIKARISEDLQRRPDAPPSDLAQSYAARFSGHSLRVGFAVTVAEAGADLRSMAKVTRHKSLAMPLRYSQKADQILASPHKFNGVGLKR